MGGNRLSYSFPLPPPLANQLGRHLLPALVRRRHRPFFPPLTGSFGILRRPSPPPPVEGVFKENPLLPSHPTSSSAWRTCWLLSPFLSRGRRCFQARTTVVPSLSPRRASRFRRPPSPFSCRLVESGQRFSRDFLVAAMFSSFF